jgi:hypothetical protein
MCQNSDLNCGLFNDALSISDYKAPDGRIIREQGIVKDFTGSCCHLVEVLTQHLLGNHKNLNQDRLCPDRDSKRNYSQYKR